MCEESGWPSGDPCPECNEPMDVGAVGNPGETITWQSCEDCGIGWGPFTGYVDLEEDVDDPDLRTDGGQPTDVIDRVRSAVDRIRDPNPFDDADDRRRWSAAWEVSRGPASAVYYTAWLAHSRRSHALFEGIDIHAGGE